MAEFSAEATKAAKEAAQNADGKISEEQKARMESEMGDVFFSLVNAARLYSIQPENALEKTNKKFINRFNHIEEGARAKGVTLSEMSLAEMDALWDEAKTETK